MLVCYRSVNYIVSPCRGWSVKSDQPTIMKFKLSEILLLAGAGGFLVIWIAEYMRTTFADSYWLMMLMLGCLLGFQYMKNKRLEREKAISPTIKQMIDDRKRSVQQ